MRKRMLFVLLLTVLFLDCAGSDDFDVFPGHQPVIHDSYARSVVRPGTIWRIYLHAEDYEGDMKEIVTFVTQTGTAPFPTNYVKLKGEDTKEAAGYLYLPTPSDTQMMGDRIQVMLVVRDSRGNTSQPVKFSLRFDYARPEEIPEKWKGVANRRLGVITNEDISPSQGRPTRGDGL